MAVNRLVRTVMAWAMASQAPGSGLEIVYSHDGPDYVRREYIVEPQQFRSEWLKQFAETFLDENPSKRYRNVRLSSRPASLHLTGLFGSHMRYEGRVHVRERVMAEDFAFAELMSVGNDAVLRIRYPGGIIERMVTRGKDPLEQLSGPESTTVEWIELWHPTSAEVASEWTENAAVFVKTDRAIAIGQAERIFNRLATRIPHLDLDMWASESSWFPYLDNAPIVNPFRLPEGTPNYPEFLKVWGIHCRVHLGSILCEPYRPRQ